MASKKSYNKLSSLFEEQEWVIRIRTALEESIEDEEDTDTAASIFRVPKELSKCKPEAYAPQAFAFGPYHHWQTHLYDTERYKLASARRVQARLADGLRLHQAVHMLLKHEYKIRYHYHNYLNFNGETLVWMMVIDAAFLIEFLRNHAIKESSKRIENEKTKIIRDIMMLENQIPLFLLRKLLGLQFPSKDLANDELAKILSAFVREVSPFKSTVFNLPRTDDIARHAHLLDLLYRTMVPKSKQCDEVDETVEEEAKGEAEMELGDVGTVKKAFVWAWTSVSSVSGGPLRFVKQAIVARPVKLALRFPWKAVTALPIFASTEPKSEDGTDSPPLAEEIAIPSVAELSAAGVQFVPTNGDVTTIKFDATTVTMYLPAITLDGNTEAVLRNLVAYEASAVSGPLVLARYTELMNGIIDTDEDVRILGERGVVVNRMRSDGEAAGMWNGMSRSVRLTKVGPIDAAIREANRYYRGRWSVKGRKYVLGSWQVLTFVAAALLLFLTCVQAFCSVYSCSSHLTKYTSIGD